MPDYYSHLLNEIIYSLPNDFRDNHDEFLLGPLPRPTFRTRAKDVIQRFSGPLLNPSYIVEEFNRLKEYMPRFADLYSLLEDDKSRELLIKLVCYRILGHEKVKLPLNTPEFWTNYRRIAELENTDDFIKVDFLGWKLKRTNLHSLNFPIELYYINLGTNCTFLLEQYKYADAAGQTVVCAQPGETVLDLGGCWGDTALYFANQVGGNGKVFSFEFIPSNLEIFRKNLSLNPKISESIHLVERPVWSESGKDMFYTDNGPASRVSFEANDQASGHSLTTSVDDLVAEQRIDKIDFIKMDIEGAELHALKGAEKTIGRDKPKLAISIYHSVDDFVGIPEYLHSLDLGYRFFLGHYTIHSGETILFAI